MRNYYFLKKDCSLQLVGGIIIIIIIIIIIAHTCVYTFVHILVVLVMKQMFSLGKQY
jgi:hypothetical protein